MYKKKVNICATVRQKISGNNLDSRKNSGYNDIKGLNKATKNHTPIALHRFAGL
jgi:hypothetical protein